MNQLRHFLTRDKHSRNDSLTPCPECGGATIKVGYNKLRDEETRHCTVCKKKYKHNLLD